MLEVYGDTAGDALELGQITLWEPGKRLAWDSSVDDVNIKVSFSPAGDGCLVRVQASIPVGGQDRGGRSWVRVTPKWFGPWCARRDSAPREVRDRAWLTLGVLRPASRDGPLAGAFGFTSPDPLPETGYGHPWIEFRLGNSSLMILKLTGNRRRADGCTCPGSTSTTSPGTTSSPGPAGRDRDRTEQPAGAAVLRRRRSRGQPVDVRPGAPGQALSLLGQPSSWAAKRSATAR